jgi:hypothetical protein
MIDRDGYCQPLDRSNPVVAWREICARTARRGFVRVSWRSPLSAWLDVLISLRMAAGTLTFFRNAKVGETLPRTTSRAARHLRDGRLPGRRWRAACHCGNLPSEIVAAVKSLSKGRRPPARDGRLPVQSRRSIPKANAANTTASRIVAAGSDRENLCRPSHRTADSPLRPLCDVRLRRWNLSARAYPFA